MDDLFQIVLVFVFLVLPILQKIFRRGGPTPPMDLPEDYPPEEGYEPVQTRERSPVGVASPAGGATGSSAGKSAGNSDTWSSDWGTWPGSTPEETAPERMPASAPAPRSRLETAKLEDVASTWDAVEAAPAGTVQERLRRITASAEAVPLRRISRSSIQQMPSRPGQATRAHLPLGSAAELRRAIILTEVLGPPLSLREPAGMR